MKRSHFVMIFLGCSILYMGVISLYLAPSWREGRLQSVGELIRLLIPVSILPTLVIIPTLLIVGSRARRKQDESRQA